MAAAVRPTNGGRAPAVYNGASTSTGYFSLNEGTLALGNNTALGTSRLVVGDPTGVNVVTLKSADSNAHTLAEQADRSMRSTSTSAPAAT